MGPHDWNEFLQLDEDDGRELLDGHWVEMDMPTKLHEWVVVILTHTLVEWALQRNAGMVLGSGYKVRITSQRGFMPDVQFFRRGGRPVPNKGLEQGGPDLAVEVISPSSARYDKIQKLQGYASIGVKEYWVVDPERQLLERLLLREGHYQVAETLGGDAEFRPETLEGYTLQLQRLWSLPAGFGDDDGSPA